MTRGNNKAAGRKPKRRIILIFGESDNDTYALKQLIAALRPELPAAESRRAPLVLTKEAERKRRMSTMEKIANVVVAQRVTHEVISVVAHRDCDAMEPAHEENGRMLLEDMRTKGLPQPVAATPAFEMESWWFLWPDALAATRPCWNRIKPRSNVGAFKDAKQELCRSLQPKGKSRTCPDYTESDSRRIAENVRVLGLIDNRCGQSHSFAEFADQICKLEI